MNSCTSVAPGCRSSSTFVFITYTKLIGFFYICHCAVKTKLLLVVIEEIDDEEKPAEENKTKRPKKKSQATADENAKKQIITKETADVPVLESEDEDGLPISKEAREPENKTAEKMDLDDNEQVSNKKRKAKASVQDVVQERYPSI